MTGRTLREVLWADLKHPRWMYLKAALFCVAGMICVAALLLESPTLRTALLLGIAVWSFARLYYFFFYVIEKYIDPTYRFDGILSALRYLMRQRRRPAASAERADRGPDPD